MATESEAVAKAPEASKAPELAGTPSALWGVSAAGWITSSVVREARPKELFDEHGRRCHQHNAIVVCRRRDQFCGDGIAVAVDREVRHPARPLHRPQERLCG